MSSIWNKASTVTTATDGTFGLDIAPPCPGSFTLTVAADQVNDHRSSRVSLTPTVARINPTIQMLVGDAAHPLQAGGWGSTVDISVPAGYGNGTYEAYTQPVRGTRKLLVQGSTFGGVVQSPSLFNYVFPRKSVVTVLFHGDQGLVPGTATFVVTVAPGSALTAVGHTSTTTGTWHFKRKADPQWLGGVGPSRLAPQVRLVIQKRVGTTWKSFRTPRASYAGNGFVNYTFPGSHQVKVPFRARLVYAGDADFVHSASAWRPST